MSWDALIGRWGNDPPPTTSDMASSCLLNVREAARKESDARAAADRYSPFDASGKPDKRHHDAKYDAMVSFHEQQHWKEYAAYYQHIADEETGRKVTHLQSCPRCRAREMQAKAESRRKETSAIALLPHWAEPREREPGEDDVEQEENHEIRNYRPSYSNR